MAEYKWQRRERKQKKAKERMPKHGKGQAQIYADSLEKREKEKEKLLGRIDKMLMKQTPLETTMGKNLQTIKPQQLAKVTNTTIPQAGQQIKQQQTQNRQMGQMQAGKMPQQQPPAPRNVQFGPNGADLIPNELKQRLDKFNSLDQLRQTDEAIRLDAKNPQDYEMAKYLAQSGSPKVQTMALNKLSAQDLDTMVQPTHPNPEAVSVLARKTQNPSYMRSMTKHASPQVRMNLLKNPNITDLTMSEMYDDHDDQIRNNIVGRSNNQELLHLFISDKNPQIRARLVDKLDHDGLKILLTDPDPHVQALAKRKLQGRFSKMQKSGDFKKPKRPIFIQQDSDRLDNNQTTSISQEKLPKYTYGGLVGSDAVNGRTFNTPSFSNKSLILKELNTFIEKAKKPEFRVEALTPDRIDMALKHWEKWARENYPDVDFNDASDKNVSPEMARLKKPYFYLKAMRNAFDEEPELRRRGHVMGIYTGNNQNLEGAYWMSPQGDNEYVIRYLVSHAKNGVPGPYNVRGIGTYGLQHALETAVKDNKGVRFTSDPHTGDYYNRLPFKRSGSDYYAGVADIPNVLHSLKNPTKITNEFEPEPLSFVSPPIHKEKIMKEFGMTGDVSTPTFNGSAGQNYKKKIGSALNFKSRGVEGVFDVMKSVNYEDIDG